MSNLRTLLIQHHHYLKTSNLDDRIVQAWANRAADDHAFAHLKVLSFVNILGITSSAFRHLSSFTMLATLLAYGTGIRSGRRDIDTAERCGWKEDQASCENFQEDAGEHVSAFSPPRTPWFARGKNAFQEFTEVQRSQTVGGVSGVYVLDAKAGCDKRFHNMPKNGRMLIFGRREPEKVRKVIEQAPTGPSKKRRKLKDAKGAEFAAMLHGD